MIHMRWSTTIVAVFGIGAGAGSGLGCHGQPEPREPVAAVAPRGDGPAQVVAHQEAARTAGATPMVMLFGVGRDGTKLVAEFLAKADAEKADVSDLAIVLQTRRDDRLVECRSEVVPESVAAAQWRPHENQVVPLEPKVTRTLTEWVYQCGPATSSQIRSRTDYEEKCSDVIRAVPRSTTVYMKSLADATSAVTGAPAGTARSYVPVTDFYTEYHSVYECEQVPVVRVGPEQVTETKCAPDLQTHAVTRYEFQLDQLYIPGHFETFPRQRLRELEPVCYTIDARTARPEKQRNRLEGLLLPRAH